jgi:hypothetical protein
MRNYPLSVLAVVLWPAVAWANDVCIRFAQLVPDTPSGLAGTLDLAPVTQPESIALTSGDLLFGTITGYQPLAAGSYLAVARAAGFQARSTTLRVLPDRSYTAIGAGLLSAGVLSPETAGDVLVLDDNTLAPPNRARIRVIQAVPETPPLEVALAESPANFSAMAFKHTTDYVEVAAGSYRVIVRSATNGDVVIETDDIQLASGTVNTLFLVGRLEGEPRMTVTPIVDAPNSCSARDFTGIWYDPAQTGQGVQLLDEEGRFGGVWYSYGSDGQTAWYTWLGTRNGLEFTGELLNFTGPPLGTPWVPEAVVGEPAGTVAISFAADSQSATLTTTINGASRTLALVPFE